MAPLFNIVYKGNLRILGVHASADTWEEALDYAIQRKPEGMELASIENPEAQEEVDIVMGGKHQGSKRFHVQNRYDNHGKWGTMHVTNNFEQAVSFASRYLRSRIVVYEVEG